MIGQDRGKGQLFDKIFALCAENPITFVFVGLNIAMFLGLSFTGGSDDAVNLYRWGAKFGPAIQNGDWYRLFSPVVLHSGWMHIAANTFALVIFGPRLERDFGRFAFLGIYVVSGVCGVAASLLVSPALSVGASGAIFGIVGAYGIYLLRNRKEFGVSVNPLILNLTIVLAVNIVIGVLIPGIDQGAHVGGLVAGAAIGWVLSPKRVVTVQNGLFIFGAPIVKTRFERASNVEIVVSMMMGLLVAFAISWSIASLIDYDQATMGVYRFYELTTG